MLHFYKFLLFIVLLTLTFTRPAYGQDTISGRVIDNDTQPIQYAKIRLMDSLNDQIIANVTTNENGNFILQFKDGCNCKLQFSFIGYNDSIIYINTEESIIIEDLILNESSLHLSEFTITQEQVLLTKKEDKIILNIESSPLKSGYDGLEVLQRSPYVSVDGKTILMRNENVRVSINDKRLMLQGSDLANYLANIPSENIKYIEIQTNSDASSDAESSGGNINIILKKRQLGLNSLIRSYYTIEGAKLYTFLSGANFNYGAENFNLYGKYEFFNRLTSVRSLSDINYSISENYLQTIGLSETQSRRQNYQIGLVTQLSEKHELGIEAFGTKLNQDTDSYGNVTIQNNDLNIDSGGIDIFNIRNNSLLNGVLNYTWKIDTNQSKLIFFADYTQQEISNASENFSIYEFGNFNNVQEKNNSSATTDIYATQIDYNKNFKKQLKLKIGGKLTFTDRYNNLNSYYKENSNYVLDSIRTTSYRYSEQITAGYLSISKNHKEKNFFKSGLRIENTKLNRFNLINLNKVNQIYTGLFPSFYYSRKTKVKTTFSASYSRSLRRPSFSLLNNNISKINDFRFVLGNPDLEPELVNKFNLSYFFKGQSISLYYNQTNNAINGIYFLEGDIAYYKKYNSGHQKQYGAEYNISKKINKWWYLKISGNLFYREFVDSQNISSFEKTTIYANLYTNFKIGKTSSIDFSGFYISPKSDAYYEAYERYKIDVVFNQSFLDKKLNFKIYVDDIFNTLEYGNIRVFDDYVTTALEKPITRSITIWLSYNISNKYQSSNRKATSKNEAKKRL